MYERANNDSQPSVEPGRNTRPRVKLGQCEIAQQQLTNGQPPLLTQPKANTTQPQSHWLRPIRPGGNAELQLVWDDLEQGVDVLAGDGTPRFLSTEEFLKLP